MLRLASRSPAPPACAAPIPARSSGFSRSIPWNVGTETICLSMRVDLGLTGWELGGRAPYRHISAWRHCGFDD